MLPEQLYREVLTLIALNRFPVERGGLLALMRQKALRKFFPAINDSEYPELFMQKRMKEEFENDVIIDEARSAYSLKDREFGDRIVLDAISRMPELANIVAREINRMSMPEPEGQMRDIRNFLFAENMDEIIHCIGEIMSISADKRNFIHSGQVFDFMYAVRDSEWIDKLPAPFVNLLCSVYLPYAMLEFQDVSKLVARAMQVLDDIQQVAHHHLTQYFLLCGKLEEAKTVMSRLEGVKLVQCQGWLAFLEGNNANAVEIFNSLAPVDVFSGIFGFFYAFAVLALGDHEHLRLLGQQLSGSGNVKIYGIYYKRLELYAERHLHRLAGENSSVYTGGDAYLSDVPFCMFINYICDFWEEHVQPEKIEQIRQMTAESYPWIAAECARMCSISHGSAEQTTGTGGIVDSVSMRPRWERVLEQTIKSVLHGDDSQNIYRLVWTCEFEPASKDCPVSVLPLEQKLSKNGIWSKGRTFQFMNCLEHDEWPDYFTAQDRLVCKIIAMELKDNAARIVRGNGYASYLIVDALVGHPLLFWEKGMRHFSCFREKSSIYLSKNSDNIEICPCYDGVGGNMFVQRNARNDLALVALNMVQKNVVDSLGKKFEVPLDSIEKVYQFVAVMTPHFSFFSDFAMDGLPIRTIDVIGEFHFMLTPEEGRMGVHLFISPYPGADELFVPGSGFQDAIVNQNENVIRYHRNFVGEIDAAQALIEECHVLVNASCTAPFAWMLESMDQCYEFTYALSNISGHAHVHWPDNKKIRVARMLHGTGMSCRFKKHNDWFSIEGGITLEDGQFVELKDMFEAVHNSNGTFIRLKDGQVLALAESIKKRIEDMSAVVSVSDDRLVFQHFATPFMRRLLDGSLSSAESAMLREADDEISNAMNRTFEVPDTLNATLRPYQVEGYQWLCRLDAWNAGACLADDMGVGKTIQVIAFMLKNASEGPALVVAPTSVCNNWVAELGRFAPSLNVILFGGTKRSNVFTRLGPGSVLVTSYGLIQSEEEEFHKVKWRVAVLDEAQAIKNHNTKRARAVEDLNAKFRIATTGTPIENNLNELWSLFNFINPGLLGTHLQFQERFMDSIENHEDKSGEQAMERLSLIVKPFILRRLKKDVLAELPPKTDVQIPVMLSQDERRFYENLRKKLLAEMSDVSGVSAQLRVKVIAAITKLRLAACNSKLVTPSSDISSSKLDVFRELLSDLIEGQHRVLVFSQFVKHLALVKPLLDKMGVTYQYLDGKMSAKEREASVKSFQKGNGDVFLISLKAGGMGINLTGADYVIHLDPWWNPAVEDQASDRAYRIGQAKPVTIYRLVASNTIEDKIIELHQSKRELADNILDGTDVVNKISPEELLKLLSGDDE